MAALRFHSDTDFGVVYQRHHKALYRYCRSILRHEEDAQDALQNTMTRALAALQKDERDLELRPWLFRIAHNESVSILRRRRVTEELADAPAASVLEDRVLEREELRALAMDLADLPERQRAALILRELNGLSHAEIGTVLDLSVGAVKTAIFEARSAVSSCREGRELACLDIRRLLSDGDGRILRGRGIRAHLRTCRDCRGFRDELGTRPRKLALLPGAALFSQLLGGTAAKIAICVVLAGASTTLAVEMKDTRGPASAAAATAQPRPAATPAAAARREPPETRTPAATRAPAEPTGRLAADAPQRHRGTAPPATTVQPAKTTPPGHAKHAPTAAAPERSADRTSPGHADPEAAKAAPPEQAKPAKDKATSPGHAETDAAKAAPPDQAKDKATAPGHATPKPAKTAAPDHAKQTRDKATPRGQAKQKPAKAAPPDQAKPATDKATPRGQAQKAEDKTPPSETKQAAAKTPPGQPKKPADRPAPLAQAKQEVAALAPAVTVAPEPALVPGQAKKDDKADKQAHG